MYGFHVVGMYILSFMMAWFILRQQKTIKKLNSRHFARERRVNSIWSRTVMLENLPARYRIEPVLRQHIEESGIGELDTVYLLRDTKDIVDLIVSYNKYLAQYERALYHLDQNIDDHSTEYDQASFWRAIVNSPEEAFSRMSKSQIHECLRISCIHRRVNELKNKIINLQGRRQSFEPIDIAFVSFKSPLITYGALRAVFHQEVGVKSVPDGNDIIWPNLRYHETRRKYLGKIATALFIFFWLIPVSFLVSCTNLQVVSKTFPSLGKFVSEIPFARSIYESAVPSIVTLLLMSSVPIFIQGK